MKEINDDEIKEIVENITLNMFNIGADKTNFKILKMLPTDLKTVMAELNLTKMPVNTRLNELEKVGLAKRLKGTGKIISTTMTEYFKELIDSIENRVEGELKLKMKE